MVVASANAYAFMASVVLFTFSSRVAKVSSQAVRFSGCDSLVEHKTVPVTVAMDAPGSSACSVLPLTQAQFKLTRANGQIDVICTQNLTSGCDTTPTPEGCVCKSLVNNVYTFELDLNFTTSVHAGGTLDLEPNCFPPGVYTTRTKCDNLQAVDPCDLINCQNGGRCESDNGNAKCFCNGTYHTGDECQVDPCENQIACAVTDYPHRAYIIKVADVLIFIIVIAVLGSGNGGVIFASIIVLVYAYLTSKTIKVCLLAKSESQRLTLTVPETATKIRCFIKKNFICCRCHGIDVEVDAKSTEDGQVSITLKYRVIWVFYLLDMQAKVEKFINTEILPEVKPVYSNEPAADYPSGLLKPSANSETAYGEVSVTPM